jgi:hypothetical protein
MDIYVKVVDGIVTEHVNFPNLEGEDYIQIVPGVNNKIPFIGDYYDSDLEMFFTPVPEDAVIN